MPLPAAVHCDCTIMMHVVFMCDPPEQAHELLHTIYMPFGPPKARATPEQGLRQCCSPAT